MKSITLIFLVFSLTAYGQKYLDVPLIGQENSKWCWAASIQMIHRFHQGSSATILQCELADMLRTFELRKGKKPPISLSNPNTCCGHDCNDLESSTVCNSDKWIPYSKRDGKINYHYFDLINSSLGYNSMEDLETLSFDWEKIKQEINSCRPFAIFLSKIEPSRVPYSHVVVAKGYQEFSSQKYVLVNDPQNKSIEPGCFGCEFLIPIDALTDATTSLNSSLQVAKSIFQKDSAECKTCDKSKPIDSDNLISEINKSIQASLLFDLSKISFSDIDLNQLLAVPNLGGPLYAKYLYNVLDSDNNFKELTAIVAIRAQPQIAVILEKASGIHKIKEVTFNSCTAFREKITLSLNTSGGVENFLFNNNQYAVLEFLQGGYFFYQVNIKNKTYLSPIKTYAGLPFRANYLYDKDLVIKQINKNSSNELKDINIVTRKKCFLLNIFHSKRVKKLK